MSEVIPPPAGRRFRTTTRAEAEACFDQIWSDALRLCLTNIGLAVEAGEINDVDQAVDTVLQYHTENAARARAEFLRAWAAAMTPG